MRMKMTGMMVTAGLMLAGMRAGAADVSADLAVLSSYVWRGQVLNDETVAQPALNVSANGFGVNVWGNYNATDNLGDEDFSEIDLTLSYGRTFGPVTLGAGVIEYLFPNTDYSATRELYLSASLPAAPLSPALSVYRDVDEADGFYASLGVSKSFALGEKATLSLGASLGAGDTDYNAFYYGVDDDALNEGVLSASVAFAVTDTLTVKPSLFYSSLLDDDIRDGARALYGRADRLAGGLSASLVF